MIFSSEQRLRFILDLLGVKIQGNPTSCMARITGIRSMGIMVQPPEADGALGIYLYLLKLRQTTTGNSIIWPRWQPDLNQRPSTIPGAIRVNNLQVGAVRKALGLL